MASDDIPLKSELESFREQWRAEVRAKVPGSKNEPQQQTAHVAGPSDTENLLQATKTQGKVSKPQKPVAGAGKKAVHHEEDEDYVQTRVFDERHPATGAGEADESKGNGKEEKTGGDEPVSALEHYEKAVEREVAGSLGDSLALYRKAFRVAPPFFAPVVAT